MKYKILITLSILACVIIIVFTWWGYLLYFKYDCNAIIKIIKASNTSIDSGHKRDMVTSYLNDGNAISRLSGDEKDALLGAIFDYTNRTKEDSLLMYVLAQQKLNGLFPSYFGKSVDLINRGDPAAWIFYSLLLELDAKAYEHLELRSIFKQSNDKYLILRLVMTIRSNEECKKYCDVLGVLEGRSIVDLEATHPGIKECIVNCKE